MCICSIFPVKKPFEDFIKSTIYPLGLSRTAFVNIYKILPLNAFSIAYIGKYFKFSRKKNLLSGNMANVKKQGFLVFT